MVNKDSSGRDNVMREEEIESFEQFLQRRAPYCSAEVAMLLLQTWNAGVESACHYLRVTRDFDDSEEGLTEEAVKARVP